MGYRRVCEEVGQHWEIYKVCETCGAVLSLYEECGCGEQPPPPPIIFHCPITNNSPPPEGWRVEPGWSAALPSTGGEFKR